MLDFDGIVLTTLQSTFSRPIVITPLVSQPSVGAYAARGVYSTNPVDLVAIPDAVLSDQHPAVWIRMNEFPIMPMAGDQLEIPPHLTMPTAGKFEVLDVDSWANGKAVLTLKKYQQ